MSSWEYNMLKRNVIWLALAATALISAATVGLAQAQKKYGYRDTPVLPGGKWHVHDSERPQPQVVTPGTSSSQEQPGVPPSDAIVLFDGRDLSHWRNDSGADATWTIEDGAMVVKRGSGTIHSVDEFADCQLHIEWSTPRPPVGASQDRGNSGVFFFDRYEIQVLDSYESPTYADGQAASIYGQYPPLVNASRKPGEWQVYDIAFTAPRFKPDGTLQSPAYVTLFHNGVLVHNHTAMIGPMAHRHIAPYTPHGSKGRIALQDHGHPVRFRNIWVRNTRDYDQASERGAQ
jgi:Domain of Unknown Function (DUF1080)